MRLQTTFGSKELVYYTIAVMFGLITVSLTYDVQQCEKTVQTDLIDVDKVEGSKWFKWARVFSFCRNLNSAYDQGCKTRDCKDCLDVCIMNDEIRNVTSLCEINCTTDACKSGCRFYARIFVKEDDNNVTLNTTMTKPLVNTSIKINDSSHMDGIDLSWSSVFSDDALKIPSLYLVTLKASKDSGRIEYIISLTENPRRSVQIKDMCRNVYTTFHNEIDLKFAFTIYPINFVGPENYTDAKDSKIFITSSYIRPVESPSVKEVLVSKPFFQKSGQDTYDHIVWEIEWKRVTNITEGFRFMYRILTCTKFQNIREINQLNPKKVDVKKEEPFLMRVANTKDDKLDTCSVSLELRARQGECFFGNPYTKTIKYGGCKTITGYPYPCGDIKPPTGKKDTLIYDFNATLTDAECLNGYLDDCPQNENITCEYCRTTKHSIKVTWEHPSLLVLLIKGYTVRWGEMKFMFIDPEKARIANITKTNTSYMLEFFANKTKEIGIQVHAETIISESKWEKKINSIQKIKLNPLEPKPISPTLAPTKTENNSPTIIAVVVVLIFAVSCSLTLYIIYRRRLNVKKVLKIDEIKMEERQGTLTADKWEISSSILTMDEKIGEGAFGHVYCAIIKTSELRKTPYAEQCSGIKLMGESTKVAAKFVKDGAQEMEYKDFYEEITLMKDIGYHENIVNMIGCSTITRPLCLVLEYMNRGDLLHYMRVFRKNEICAGAALSAAAVAGAGDVITEKGDYLSPRDVMSFSWQIACGMEYLSINNVVHRDLAARNILISDDKKIKISDFGLSRFVNDELIYVSNNKNRKLPIKWMSIEAIYHQEFTTFSDVWAYGVVLFEIVTLGGTPYPSIGNRELCKMLKSGYRMDKPDNCEDTVYDIMLHCWNEIPTQRPTFTELREHLEDLVEKGEMYFSFDIDENDTYYNVASFKSIPSDADDDDDDVFRNEFVEKPIQIKSLNRSRDNSIKSRNSSLKSRTSGKSDELRVDVDSNRYFSPQSINVFKESKNYSSFDNQGFDEDNGQK